jgi:hypothetical protein
VSTLLPPPHRVSVSSRPVSASTSAHEEDVNMAWTRHSATALSPDNTRILSAPSRCAIAVAR